MRDDARALGVVYTPPAIAAAMVRVALEPIVNGKTAEQLLGLRVCDFAIGEGVFLVEVVRLLGAEVAAAWRREGVERGEVDARLEVAARCIAGVDVDARAVDAARRDVEAGARALRVGDALELDWDGAFPEVFEAGGFDAVIGNPPYVRQERLGAHKPALREYASYDGVADLYVYFIELAHRILRPGGRYCLITPNKWLMAAYARPLRAFLAGAGSVEGIVDVGRLPLFAGADAFPCIAWGTAGAAHDEPILATRICDDAREEGEDLLAAAARVAAPHPRERWRAEPWHVDTPRERALIDRLASRWPSLGEVVAERPARGVVTGCNRAFVIDRATRERLIEAEPAAAGLIRPFVKGRDLRRWLPEQVERWILLIDRGTSLDELPGVAAHLARFRSALEPRPAGFRGAWYGRKPGSYRWYELQDPVGALAVSRAPRLLYQDIQTAPACCLDRSGELVPDTTVWMLPSADLYLLAVLCSPVYRWYALRRFPPALNGAVRPKLDYMRTLPIATPAPDARAEIERLVERRLALEPDRRRGDGDAREATHALDARLAEAVLAVYELTAAELDDGEPGGPRETRQVT